MTTNLKISDTLISEALKLSGKSTKKEAVTDAIVEFIQNRKQKRIFKLFGKIDYQIKPNSLRKKQSEKSKSKITTK